MKYKRRNDSVGRYVHWQFCGKLGFNRAKLWYEHEPESVIENENFKILWDFTIQCDNLIETRGADCAVVDKVRKETSIIDMTIPGDARVRNKEQEKIKKYSLLKDKIARSWQMEKVVVVSIVAGALGAIKTKPERYIESLGIDIRIGHVQKLAFFGTVRIIGKVLSY